MKKNINALRRILMFLTAVLAGCFLFIASASVLLDGAVFNPGAHKALFARYDIYGNVGKIASDSINNYINSLDPGTSGSAQEERQIVSIVKKAASPEMIRFNTDRFIDGLTSYFKGETRFLPDIYLDPTSSNDVNSKNSANNSNNANSLSDSNKAITEKSFEKIDSINLSVILMYLNRGDITNKLSVIRLMQFIISGLPILSLYFALLTTLIAILAASRRKALLSWGVKALLSAGLLNFAAGIFLLGFTRIIMPRKLTALETIIPLPGTTITAYMDRLLKLPLLCMPALGLVLIAAAYILKKSVLNLNLKALSNTGPSGAQAEKAGFLAAGSPSKAWACCVLILFTVILGALEVHAEVYQFHERDLSVVLQRIKGSDISTRVIAAKDAVVYSIEVRILDKESGSPIPGVSFDVAGMKGDISPDVTFKGLSDKDGVSSFASGRGRFKLSFNRESFPEGYNIPGDYVFDTIQAGITVVTINLEKAEEKKPGTAEVQVLGNDNKPLDMVQLQVVELIQLSSTSQGRIYSFTNSEGVAVFSLPEGSYSVEFSEAGFPKGYEVPKPVSINVLSDSISRYTVKLVAAPIEAVKSNKTIQAAGLKARKK